MSKASLLTEIPIPLSVPVAVAGADGKDAERSKLVMRRPKVRHAKRLAALIGADIVSELMGQLPAGATAEDAGEKVDGRALVADLLPKLMSQERLDAFTQIVADMCGEDAAIIDDLDLVDLVAVGKAFLDFFPALRSLQLTGSPQS